MPFFSKALFKFGSPSCLYLNPSVRANANFFPWQEVGFYFCYFL